MLGFFQYDIKNEKDNQILRAFIHTVNLYKDDNLEIFYNDIKRANFADYFIEKSANVIFIISKENNRKIFSIKER